MNDCVNRFKASVGAQGFSQVEGIDYHESMHRSASSYIEGY